MKTRLSTKKYFSISIEEKPTIINNSSTFSHWELNSVLGLKNVGEHSIMTFGKRQTRFAVIIRLSEKKFH